MRLLIIPAVGLALLVALALTLSSRSNQDDREPLSPQTREAVSPETLADTPQAFYRQPLTVDGRVTATGREGRFALSGERGTILVQPEPAASAELRPGDRVRVFGVLNYLDRLAAGDVGALGRARTGNGAPYVAADAIRPLSS